MQGTDRRRRRSRWMRGGYAAAIVVGLGCLSTPVPATSPVRGDSRPASGALAGTLTVSGKVPKPVTLKPADFARLPRQSVRVTDRDGKDVEYTGVTLAELLNLAGIHLTPDELRGGALEFYLVVEAADGYRVVFALPELSTAYTERVVLLADRRDGKPLTAEEGPYRVVVPGERRQARWVRQVVNLKLGQDRVAD